MDGIGVSSTFAWLHYSERERRRACDVLDRIATSSETPLTEPGLSHCIPCDPAGGDCRERVTEPPEAASTDPF